MYKSIVSLCIFFIAIANTSIAQSKNKLAKKEGQKYIGVDYVKFDTTTKFYLNYASYKDYLKMVEDGTKDKKQNKWRTQSMSDPRIFSGTGPQNIFGRKPNSQQLDYALTKVLKQTGFIDTVNQIFKNEGNIVYLQPVIGDENYYLIADAPSEKKKEKINLFKCKMDVTWRITNVYSEVLDSVMITTETNEFDSTSFFSLSMMEKFFTQAVDELLANKKLEKYFITSTNTAAAKPTLSSVTKPTSVITAATEAQLATVIVKTVKGHGSGFAISNDGYIITNYHVISSENPNKPEEVTIILSDATKVKATFIKANKDRDIALLKIDSKFEKCFQIPTQKNFKVFDEIFAMGTPKSIELGQSASKGILSSERNVNNVSLLQVSMNINSGNSGGPMFNTSGNLVGVVSAKLFGFGVEGVAFGLPAYKINDYLNIEFK